MAFINERISEEDKTKYKIEKISDYQYRRWSDWTIDRDRDCFLLYNGMSHDLPPCRYFILYYQGFFIKIEVEVKGNGVSKEGINLTNYDITYIQLSDMIADKKDDIIQIFSEAIGVHEDKKFLNRKVSVLYLGKKLEVN